MKTPYSLTVDRPELVNRCLNCPYPPEICTGEYHCHAKSRNETIIKQQIVQYGLDHGYSLSQIVQSTDGYISRSFVDDYLMKLRNGTGNKWGR